jgi:hypothetical protein
MTTTATTPLPSSLEDIQAEIERRLAVRLPVTHCGWTYLPQLARLRCVDGFNVSLQASETHYCAPRDNFGPWFRVELGFPSGPMPGLEEWQEDRDTLETVWGYVPLREVARVLALHGGLLPEAAHESAA